MVKTTTPGASRLEMLDENVVLKPIDIKTPSQNALDKRFGNEDKDVVFSFATFCEEAFVQTSFAFWVRCVGCGPYQFARLTV